MKALLAAIIAVAVAAFALPAPVLGEALIPVPPAATTGAATSIGRTTATATGTVDPNASATTYYVEYGTSTAYGLRSTDRSAGDGDAPISVSVALSGLTSDTTYHYRVVATNAAGVARGADRTLRTTRSPNPLPPVVVTGAFAELGARGVTLTGSVNPRGVPTTYRFEYGVGTSLNRSTASSSAGTGTVAVAFSTRLTLTPATRYSYRIAATNAAGTSRGARRSFTTPAEVQRIQLDLSSDRVVYGDGVTVSGQLLGSGTRNVPVALELQRFPFTGPFKQIGANKRASSSGRVSFTVPTLIISSKVRLVTRAGVAATSLPRTVRTAVRPGLRVQRLSGRRVRFSGVVRPAVSGATVSLQRRKGGRFQRIRKTAVRPDARGRSSYRMTVRERRQGGVYRVIVVPPRSSGHVRNGSRELFVRGTRGRTR